MNGCLLTSTILTLNPIVLNQQVSRTVGTVAKSLLRHAIKGWLCKAMSNITRVKKIGRFGLLTYRVYDRATHISDVTDTVRLVIEVFL